MSVEFDPIKLGPRRRRVDPFLVGVLVVAIGLALVPLPGPGWLIVFLGLAVLASEFDWAKVLLRFARDRVRAWGEWLAPQRWWVKGFVALATAAAVVVFFYLLFLVSGVPSILPDLIEGPLHTRLGL